MDGMVVMGILKAHSVLIKEGYYVHKLKTNFTFPIEKQSKASSCQSKDKQESGKTCSKKNFKLREVSDQIKYKIRVLEGMLTFLFSLLFCTRGTGPGAWA